MIVRWVATGACAAATMIVRAATTAKWVRIEECIATVMRIETADDTGRRDRDDRGWDRPDRDRDYRGYDEDRPRRRVKVCVEYENGDEYCRYRQGIDRSAPLAVQPSLTLPQRGSIRRPAHRVCRQGEKSPAKSSKLNYAAALSSLSVPRATIFSASSGSGR